MPELLKAPLVVEFPFTRSLGPVQSAFLTGLRERVVLGVRTADDRVLVPPRRVRPCHRRGDPRPRRGRPHRHRRTDRAGAARSPRPPAWMLGGAMRSEPTLFAGKDFVSPQAGRDCAADVYRQAGIADPRRDIDAVEMYVPFSWYEPMWLENLGFADEGEGWKLTESGVTELDGDLPVNMSGGVLSTNPIGASGMIRFAEAALQVRGRAGEHQVDGARRVLGHAYGGGSQFFSMWLVGAEPPTT